MSGGDNNPIGKRLASLRADLAAHDAAPWRLREVLCRAPWRLHTADWLAGLDGDVESARRHLIGAISRRIGVEAGRCWGDDHPQAEPGSPALPEWARPCARRRRPTP